MWLVFELGDGQSFIAEFAETATVQDVRDLLACEFSLADGFVLAVGSYSFPSAAAKLSEIHGLADMSVVSVQSAKGKFVLSGAFRPAVRPARRRNDPRPRLQPADSLIVPEAIHAPLPPVGPPPPRLRPISPRPPPTPPGGIAANARSPQLGDGARGIVRPRVSGSVRIGRR
jgi:hypothetical protein